MPRRNHLPAVLFLSVVCGALMGISTPASAQEGISLDTFRPASSVNSLFELTLPTPKKHLKWTASGLISHAQEPIFREMRRYRHPTRHAYPVWYRRQLDLAFSIGVLDSMEIGLVLPVVIYQINDEDSDDIQRAGLSDPRIDFKWRFLDGEKMSLGAGIHATIPLGHYASSGRDYLGSKLPTVEPRLMLESHLGSLLLAANGGFMVRQKAAAGDTRQPSAITWNLGAGFDIDDFNEADGFRLIAEAHGEFGIDFDGTSMPVETLFGFKYRSKGDVVFTFGGGPGISRGLGTPVYRAFFGVAYDNVLRNCPAGPEDMDGFEDNDRCIDPDNDQDGILDEDDQCPNEAEDMDKYQDTDGCPDTDNDGDAILDGVDACPFIPEDKDDYEDEDGCPEEGPGKATVKITDTQLLVSSKVYFDFDRATIKEVSYPILDAVAETLMGNPHIEKLQIEGHTDNEGTEEYNQSLSEQRAKAVMDYLINKGIPEDRVSYKGFGFTRPKASNDTEVGKAINRRVEFTIVHGEAK